MIKLIKINKNLKIVNLSIILSYAIFCSTVSATNLKNKQNVLNQNQTYYTNIEKNKLNLSDDVYIKPTLNSKYQTKNEDKNNNNMRNYNTIRNINPLFRGSSTKNTNNNITNLYKNNEEQLKEVKIDYSTLKKTDENNYQNYQDYNKHKTGNNHTHPLIYNKKTIQNKNNTILTGKDSIVNFRNRPNRLSYNNEHRLYNSLYNKEYDKEIEDLINNIDQKKFDNLFNKSRKPNIISVIGGGESNEPDISQNLYSVSEIKIDMNKRKKKTSDTTKSKKAHGSKESFENKMKYNTVNSRNYKKDKPTDRKKYEKRIIKNSQPDYSNKNNILEVKIDMKKKKEDTDKYKKRPMPRVGAIKEIIISNMPKRDILNRETEYNTVRLDSRKNNIMDYNIMDYRNTNIYDNKIPGSINDISVIRNNDTTMFDANNTIMFDANNTIINDFFFKNRSTTFENSPEYPKYYYTKRKPEYKLNQTNISKTGTYNNTTLNNFSRMNYTMNENNLKNYCYVKYSNRTRLPNMSKDKVILIRYPERFNSYNYPEYLKSYNYPEYLKSYNINGPKKSNELFSIRNNKKLQEDKDLHELALKLSGENNTKIENELKKLKKDKNKKWSNSIYEMAEDIKKFREEMRLNNTQIENKSEKINNENLNKTINEDLNASKKGIQTKALKIGKGIIQKPKDKDDKKEKKPATSYGYGKGIHFKKLKFRNRDNKNNEETENTENVITKREESIDNDAKKYKTENQIILTGQQIILEKLIKKRRKEREKNSDEKQTSEKNMGEAAKKIFETYKNINKRKKNKSDDFGKKKLLSLKNIETEPTDKNEDINLDNEKKTKMENMLKIFKRKNEEANIKANITDDSSEKNEKANITDDSNKKNENSPMEQKKETSKTKHNANKNDIENVKNDIKNIMKRIQEAREKKAELEEKSYPSNDKISFEKKKRN